MATSPVSNDSGASAARTLMAQMGAGSGVDTKTLAESLVEAERAPRKAALDRKIASSEAKISGYGAMMMNLDTIKKAFAALDDPSDVNSLTVNNSNTSALVATATTGAIPGNHSIDVLSLAKAQRSASLGFSSATASLNGGAAFVLRMTTVGGASKGVLVPANRATPEGMVTAINTANIGLTAQLVNTNDGTANPFKVVITGAEGADNAFSIVSDNRSGVNEQQTLTFGGANIAGVITVDGVPVSVASGDSAASVAAKVKTALETDSSKRGLGRVINHDGAGNLTLTFGDAEGARPDITFADTDGTGATFTTIESRAFAAGSPIAAINFSDRIDDAKNASLKVNGLTLTRASNKITDAIPGVTLELKALSSVTGTASVQLVRDTSALKDKVKALVQSFNDAMSDFGILTGPKNKKDETDVYSGSLQNDSTVLQVRNQLRSMFLGNSSTPGTTVQALRDIGVSITKEGTLEFSDKQFDATTTGKFDEVMLMLTANKESKSLIGNAARGVAGDAVKTITDMMKATGSIPGQVTSANKQIERYKADLEKLSDRMSMLLARYTKTFAVMDSIVGQSNSVRERLKAQFNSNNNN
jgi:flagellar hook-associated protein 2